MTEKQSKKVVKFSVQDLLGIGFTLIVTGIGLAYGVQIMGDSKDDFGTDSCAARSDAFTEYDGGACSNGTHTVPVGDTHFNATVDGISGVAKLPQKLPTIVTVVVAAVIIGILVTYLYQRFVR